MLETLVVGVVERRGIGRGRFALAAAVAEMVDVGRSLAFADNCLDAVVLACEATCRGYAADCRIGRNSAVNPLDPAERDSKLIRNRSSCVECVPASMLQSRVASVAWLVRRIAGVEEVDDS